MNPQNRRRPPLACEQCRQRKIRCDRKSPCSNCVRLRRPSCTYVPVDPKTIAVRYGQTVDLNSSSDSASSTSTNAPKAQADQTDLASVKALKDRVRQLEHTLEEVLGMPECTVTPKDPAINGRFLKTRFFGNSHRSNICESKFHDLLLLFHRFNADEHSDIHLLHSKCKQIGRTIKAQTISTGYHNPNFHDLVPPKAVADRLVRAYFRTFESVYHIIHQPAFLRQYDRYWVNAKSAVTPIFIIHLLLIMSIGIIFEHTQIPRSTVAQWVSTGQAWLTSPCDRGRADFESIQAHCLLLLARQVTAIGTDIVWLSSGSLLHGAMQLGLHLDPYHVVGPSAFHSELRRRLWATVLELVVQAAMDAGSVPLIGLDDYDCKFPSNLSDNQVEQDIHPPAARETFTDSSIQIALLRSFPVRLQIARAINDFRDGPSYEETARLSSELTRIYQETAPLLHPSNEDTNSRPSPFQEKLYDLMTQRFHLTLHDSFCTQAKSNPAYAFSRQFLLKTSLRILALSESPEESSDFMSLILCGGATFRDVPMQAAAVVCDELLTRITEDNALSVASSVSRKYEDLRIPLKKFLSSSLARLQTGETNCKSYIMFSALLARADAMQAGRNAKEAIKESIRESLATCSDILEAVAGELSTYPKNTHSNALGDEVASDLQDDGLFNDDFAGDLYTWIQGYN